MQHDIRTELSNLKDDFNECKIHKAKFVEDLINVEKTLSDMQRDIATLLAEQAKMKGFIGGVSFVFAGLGAIIAHFIDKFLK